MYEEAEYKGKKILVLKRTEYDKYSFSFGVSKAKLIIEHMEDIKRFVEKNDITATKPK